MAAPPRGNWIGSKLPNEKKKKNQNHKNQKKPKSMDSFSPQAEIW